MMEQTQKPTERPYQDKAQDDTLLPFAVSALDMRGRIVRLGALIDDILRRHAYPDVISKALGEACALCVLLGSSMKNEGRFQLQTKTNGIISMLVVDFDAPDGLRAMARFDAARLDEALATMRARGLSPDLALDAAHLFGSGHLALTLDPGGYMARYQGVVELHEERLEEAAHRYFRQSEQIPTLIRLAVGREITNHGSFWRAGGLMTQFLPDNASRLPRRDLDPGDRPDDGSSLEAGLEREDEAWLEVSALMATVEDHELVDPQLSSERLLYRLFHERGVSVFEALPLVARCRCSDGRVTDMLRSFTSEERADMIDEAGKISVTCEFCSTLRQFSPEDF